MCAVANSLPTAGEFAKRLPIGEVEKLRKAMISFFVVRNFQHRMAGGVEGELPLMTSVEVPPLDQALDLSMSSIYQLHGVASVYMCHVPQRRRGAAHDMQGDHQRQAHGGAAPVGGRHGAVYPSGAGQVYYRVGCCQVCRGRAAYRDRQGQGEPGMSVCAGASYLLPLMVDITTEGVERDRGSQVRHWPPSTRIPAHFRRPYARGCLPVCPDIHQLVLAAALNSRVPCAQATSPVCSGRA